MEASSTRLNELPGPVPSKSSHVNALYELHHSIYGRIVVIPVEEKLEVHKSIMKHQIRHLQFRKSNYSTKKKVKIFMELITYIRFKLLVG